MEQRLLHQVSIALLTLSNLTHYPRSRLTAILGQRSQGRKFYKSPAVEIFYCMVYA